MQDRTPVACIYNHAEVESLFLNSAVSQLPATLYNRYSHVNLRILNDFFYLFLLNKTMLVLEHQEDDYNVVYKLEDDGIIMEEFLFIYFKFSLM